MLVLSRQRDETIMIGDDVEITVVDIRGDKVRLGITAPRHIQVHRKEVYEAIKRENQQASKLSPRDVAPAVERDAEKNRSERPFREPSGELRDAEGKPRAKESGGGGPVSDSPAGNPTERSP
jgi:carbon storage regulator